MAEWIVCAHCQLKHTRRGDGRCPRCHASMETTAPPAATSPSVSIPTEAASPAVAVAEPVTRTPRVTLPPPDAIAGLVLVVNAMVNLADAAGTPSASGVLGMSGVADLVVGGLLLAGNASARELALLRAVGGGILFPLLHLAHGSLFYAVLQVVLSLSTIGLLWRKPKGARLAVAAAAAGLCVAVQVISVAAIRMGTNPFGRLAWIGQLESRPVTTVEGSRLAYRMDFPADTWYLRRRWIARKSNPLADRWFVRSDGNAQVVVTVETLPDNTAIDMDRREAAFIANVARKWVNYVGEYQSIPSPRARVLHTRGIVEGIEMETITGLFGRAPYLIQVVAFTTRRHFADLKDELGRIVASFDLPPDGSAAVGVR